MRVLIAEDSAMGRLPLQRAVEMLGHTCLVATDGLSAWELFERDSPDVVISDWMMPGLEGPELCRRIRSRSDTPYVYFVFLTVNREKEHALVGVQAGADDYLTKPLDPRDLKMCLIAAERVISVHRGLAEKTAELERANRELYESARTDPLTRVGNRLRLHEDLDQLDSRVARYGHTYSVAMCDLDHFKAYNDALGHPAGDAALRALADILKRHCRESDSVYRYGGEEFAIIMPEQSLGGAATAMERLRLAVERAAIAHPASRTAPILTISVGVAERRLDDANTAAALNRADAALYEAKQAGRNRVQVDTAAPPIPA
jgi:two-component system chemotaxis response regulator CheY